MRASSAATPNTPTWCSHWRRAARSMSFGAMSTNGSFPRSSTATSRSTWPSSASAGTVLISSRGQSSTSHPSTPSWLSQIVKIKSIKSSKSVWSRQPDQHPLYQSRIWGRQFLQTKHHPGARRCKCSIQLLFASILLRINRRDRFSARHKYLLVQN